jgi:hypothetical protein
VASQSEYFIFRYVSIEYIDILFSRYPQSYDDESSSDVQNVGAFNNSDLFNAMINPFTRMVITGAIWYQGNNEFRTKTKYYDNYYYR